MRKKIEVEQITQLQRDLSKAKGEAANAKFQLKKVRAQLVDAHYEITRLRASQLVGVVA